MDAGAWRAGNWTSRVSAAVEYETRTRLALELWSPEGDRYGLAYVYPEGYPGCPRLVPFSH